MAKLRQLEYDDRRSLIQVNRELHNTLAPYFYERIGMVDIAFLNENEGRYNVDGLRKYGERLRNLTIHNISRDMLPVHEAGKLKDVLARYYDQGSTHQLDTLTFSTQSTLHMAIVSSWARRDSFKFLEKILTTARLPRTVVFPAAYIPGYIKHLRMPFGCIMSFSTAKYLNEGDAEVLPSPRERTTLYLRPGTHTGPLDPMFKFHEAQVEDLAFFGDYRENWSRLNNFAASEMLRGDAFASLTGLSFHSFELRDVVDVSLPTSIERLSFIDNTMEDATDLRGEEEIMKRFLLSANKSNPGIKPILRKFDHRQTVRWPQGTCTIAGNTLVEFVKQTRDMEILVLHQNRVWDGHLAQFAVPTLKYASHRHGPLDRSATEIKSFLQVARGLIGFGTNFRAIDHSQLGSMDNFKLAADSFAVRRE